MPEIRTFAGTLGHTIDMRMRTCAAVTGSGTRLNALNMMARPDLVAAMKASIPPMVDYSLTPLGRTLDEPLAGIRDWAERYIEQVQAARDVYVRQPPAASSPPGSKASQAGRRRDAE